MADRQLCNNFQDALNLPEEAGPITKKKEEKDENPSPTDSVLLGHVSLFLQHLHGRVLIQPDAELGKLELNLISHFSDKDVAVLNGKGNTGVSFCFERPCSPPANKLAGRGGCYCVHQEELRMTAGVLKGRKEQEHFRCVRDTCSG